MRRAASRRSAGWSADMTTMLGGSTLTGPHAHRRLMPRADWSDAGWIIAHPDQVAEAKRLLARGEEVPRWAKRYAVYRRRGLPCPRCGTPVASERLGLQTMYWCPGCQEYP
ncbi:hypothetical protein ET989_12220 [Propioniciclava sinopodophylli]|uniref:FPG-type domain-containing protein n=2 Tax=Propioniciclava sinopodophylli TaxID=1837344 RepID=A0A4Q9KBT7_9ACTN|nr:hypothetical protein ET989_12220 [Propioniciclava sinopodophylli]